MVRKKILLLIYINTIIFLLIFSINVSAYEAGVGVLNVPPKYGRIRITQIDNTVRVLLTISDYNSWADIYSINIVITDGDLNVGEFLFTQYKDVDSFTELNEFSEKTIDKNLLIHEKCYFERSDKKITTDQRCDIELFFVFKTTYFTTLEITVKDREGKEALTIIDYTGIEESRSNNLIIIPWFDNPIVVKIPPYLPNLIALTTASVGTLYCANRKIKIIKTRV